MFCQKCGTQNPDGAAFCSSCGAPLAENKPNMAPPMGQPNMVPPNNMGQPNPNMAPNMGQPNMAPPNNMGQLNPNMAPNMGQPPMGQRPNMVPPNNMGQQPTGQRPNMVPPNNMGQPNPNMGQPPMGQRPNMVPPNNMGQPNPNMGQPPMGQRPNMVPPNNMGQPNPNMAPNMGQPPMGQRPNMAPPNNMGQPNIPYNNAPYPGQPMKKPLKVNIGGIIACVLLAICVFLPLISVSAFGVSAAACKLIGSEEGVSELFLLGGIDGIIVLVVAVGGIVCSIFGINVVLLVAGAVDGFLIIYNALHIKSAIAEASSYFYDISDYVKFGIAFWGGIVATVVAIVFGIIGLVSRSKQKKNQPMGYY